MLTKFTKVTAFALAVLLILSLSVAAGAEAVFAFEKASYEVNAGKTLKLVPILQGAEAPKGAKYIWATSDKSIATVSSGTVTGKSGGTVTITCQMLDSKKNVLYETSCEVTVFQPIKKIVMNPKGALAMIVSPAKGPAYTYQLDVTVTPANASNQELRYTSLTPSLLSVTQDGLVTAKPQAWGGIGYVQIEATDGSGVAVVQKIVCKPFIITTTEIVMEERGAYRLLIPVGVNEDFWNEYWLPWITAKGSGYYLEGVQAQFDGRFTPLQVSDTDAAFCWFDVRPIKAGTYTIKLGYSIFWDKDVASEYTFKIIIKDSAAYNTKSFPALKYAAAMADPAAAVGQQVSLKGYFVESWRDDNNCWNYVIATGKGNSNPVVIRAPSYKRKFDFVAAEEVTVFGTFAEPLEEQTETGLTILKLVVDAEMINGVCYNTDVYEVEMYDPELANKKTAK